MAARTMPTPTPCRVIVSLDLDCFYAQCEELRDPQLKGTPLGVQQKMLVITSNYAARKYGIKKGDSLSTVRRKCPSITICNGEDLTWYRDVSHRVFQLATEWSPSVERLGMDEVFIDITDRVDSRVALLKEECKEERARAPHSTAHDTASINRATTTESAATRAGHGSNTHSACSCVATAEGFEYPSATLTTETPMCVNVLCGGSSRNEAQGSADGWNRALLEDTHPGAEVALPECRARLVIGSFIAKEIRAQLYVTPARGLPPPGSLWHRTPLPITDCRHAFVGNIAQWHGSVSQLSGRAGNWGNRLYVQYLFNIQTEGSETLRPRTCSSARG